MNDSQINFRIEDVTAVKPADWDTNVPQYIEDKDAVKPEGWLEQESALINDPTAVKPLHWMDEKDGLWVAPKISKAFDNTNILVNPKCSVGCGPWKAPLKRNPQFRGPWKAPMIQNPAYRGPWKARQIPNAEHWIDPEPNVFFPSIGLGIEVWTLQGGILFDNILICRNEQEADQFAESTWTLKYDRERLALEGELHSHDEQTEPNRKSFGSNIAERIAGLSISSPIPFIRKNPSIALNFAILLVVIVYGAYLLKQKPKMVTREKNDDIPLKEEITKTTKIGPATEDLTKSETQVRERKAH